MLLATAAMCVRAVPARAQVGDCRPTAYHHAGCDDGSGPDIGKWAWNPGEPCNWPGLGVTGNVHWWVQYAWHDPYRHQAVRARDGDLPSLEAAFYDTDGRCGCDVDVLGVRVRHHIHPPDLNAVVFRVLRGDCPSSNRSVLRAYFTSTRHIHLGAAYDFSVDARAHIDRASAGQANLIWEADGSGRPSGGCPANPRARVWLGRLRHCIDLRLKSADPTGICCSTSHRSPFCAWTPCGS
jgi:hypothetical protein